MNCDSDDCKSKHNGDAFRGNGLIKGPFYRAACGNKDDRKQVQRWLI